MKKMENNQCRACYNATKGLKLLTNLTKCSGKPQGFISYAELLAQVTNLHTMEDSYKELPQFICDGCSRKLKAAHAFIQQTHEVNERLVAMLANQMETNKQLDCLQEAQVDIKSCLKIKIENDDAATNDESDAKYHVEPKLEEMEECSQSNLLDLDVLCELKKSANVGALELMASEKKRNHLKLGINEIKNENNDVFERILKKDVESNINSKTSIDLFKYDGCENDIDNDGVDGDELNEIVWPRVQERDNIRINKKAEKKSSKKIRKYKEMVTKSERTDDDDDVAVPCSQCNKIFNNSKALMRHQRTSHIPEEQKCTCPLCFRKFSRSCNMYTHMRTFHGPDTVPLIRKPSTQERIFQCDKCPRNYTTRKHLNIHIKNKHNQKNESNESMENEIEDIKMHINEDSANTKKPKRYEVRSLCSICGSSFSSKTHLIVHMRRHTGERPFKCDLCDRAYPRISELTCHRRIHTGEKPFACKICGKTFRVSSKMTTHMRSHTDIRPYKCTQCERSFKYSKDLSIHFRIHTGERPYHCNVCGSTFTQSNTLKAHRVKLGHMDNTNNLV